eukprot:Awhi_evm1s2783
MMKSLFTVSACIAMAANAGRIKKPECASQALTVSSSQTGQEIDNVCAYGIILTNVFNNCDVSTQTIGFDFENVTMAIQNNGTALSISGLTKATTTANGVSHLPFGYFDLNVLIPGDFKFRARSHRIIGKSFLDVGYIGSLTEVDTQGDSIDIPMIIELQSKAKRNGRKSFHCRAKDNDPNCNGWLMHRVIQTGDLVPNECRNCEYEYNAPSDFRFVQDDECVPNPDPEPKIERCCEEAVGAQSSENGASKDKVGNYGIVLNKVFDECNVTTQLLGFDFENVTLAIQDDGNALSITGLTKARTTNPEEETPYKIDFGFFEINVLIPGDFKLVDGNYIEGESFANMEYIGALTQVNEDGSSMEDPMVIELQTKAASDDTYSFRCLPSDSDPNCNGWLMHRVSQTGSLVPSNCKTIEYENHPYSDFRFVQDQECKAKPDICLEPQTKCTIDVCSFEPLKSKVGKDGPCRFGHKQMGTNGKDFVLHQKLNRSECEALCLSDDNCVAYEAQKSYTRCEIWTTSPTYAKQFSTKHVCKVKQC